MTANPVRKPVRLATNPQKEAEISVDERGDDANS
jgi:hypothetical protein